MRAVDWQGSNQPNQCPECGRPFTTADRLLLHRGKDHPGSLSTDTRAAYRARRRVEEKRLRRHKFVILFVLALGYFLFVITYAFVT